MTRGPLTPAIVLFIYFHFEGGDHGIIMRRGMGMDGWMDGWMNGEWTNPRRYDDGGMIQQQGKGTSCTE
jgi:hypothetical protein